MAPADVRSEEITLEIPGARLAGKRWGDPEGRPLLGLHGWLDNANTHDRLAPLLLEADPSLCLVALDLPGHGRSSHKPDGTPYHFADWIADVAHALDALGWSRCSLIGHSMGAGISSLLAGTEPERFDRVVLLEGLGPLIEPEDGAPRRLERALERERAKLRNRRPKKLHGSPEDAAAKVAEVSRMRIDSARLLIERGLEAVEGGHRWRADSRLRQHSRLRLTEGQVLAFLGRIACPVLLVQAEDGFPYDPELMKGRVARVPDIRVETLPGSHHVHLDDPEAVARLVIPFLAAD